MGEIQSPCKHGLAVVFVTFHTYNHLPPLTPLPQVTALEEADLISEMRVREWAATHEGQKKLKSLVDEKKLKLREQCTTTEDLAVRFADKLRALEMDLKDLRRRIKMFDAGEAIELSVEVVVV